MFFVRLIRIVLGYVRFSVEGVFAERFLNLAAGEKLTLWGIRKIPGGFSASVRASQYKRLLSLRRKSRVRIKISERKGLPFLIKAHRTRYGIAVGIVLCVAVWVVMSFFIWGIDISGNSAVSTQRISESLAKYGLANGSFKPSLDVRNIENSVLLDIKELSWIAVNIVGNRAQVLVSERTMPPQMRPNDDKLVNVVAKKDGQILRMDVYSGQAMVKPGYAVKKGDLLVSGIMEDKSGNAYFLHARALAIAVVEEQYTLSQPLEEQVKVFGPKSNFRYRLSVGKFLIPLYLRDVTVQSELFDTRENVRLFGIALPIVIEKREYRPYELKPVIYTEEEAKGKALTQAMLKENEIKAYGSIISKSISGKVADGCFLLQAVYLVKEDIALEADIGN